MIKGFLTIKHGHQDIGTLHLELFDDVVPKTVKNFVALLKGTGRLTYRNSTSHRLIPGFMAQFGDITHGNGTGGESIYGANFDDENFVLKHDRKGMLSMANSGPGTNSSQFFVTFRSTPHLDGKHVVFGRVDLEKSSAVLRKLEEIKSDSKTNVPLKPVLIVDCGITENDDDDDDENDNGNKKQAAAAVGSEKGQTIPEEPVIEEEEEEEDTTNMTKSQAIRSRLRKLKLKMNQARQLNQVSLRSEGEAMVNGATKMKKGQKKKLNQNAAAVKAGKELGIDAYSLAESAASSMERAKSRAERQETGQYPANDFINVEAQHLRYERHLKTIPKQSADSATLESTTMGADHALLMDPADQDKEREGARRLANEMQRRIEKNKKRNRLEFDETDVSYINQRNKRFNQKISRNYDEATNEIKQNLERGTAL